jgi:hypothetical protein
MTVTQGAAVYQGTAYTLNFTFEDDDDVVIDITGWTFAADIKDTRADETALVSLTTANGGFTVTDGPNGRLEMVLTAEQTDLLPEGGMVFDLLRTDSDPGPVYYLGGSFRVKRPVTQL